MNESGKAVTGGILIRTIVISTVSVMNTEIKLPTVAWISMKQTVYRALIYKM